MFEFFVYRGDRSSLNNDSDVGGVVLIAIRSHIHSELVTVPGNEIVEMVLVLWCLDSVWSGSTYRSYYEAFERALNSLDLDPADELWVFGDFNLSSINWISQSVSGSRIDGVSSGFVDENVLIPSNVGGRVKVELFISC